MLHKIEIYFGQGLYYLKSSVGIAVIIYSIILAVLRIIGNRKSIKIKSVSIKKMIFEYLLVLNIVTILQITGVIGMSLQISSFAETIQLFKFKTPFVGSSILMITLNLMLFVPLGFLIPVALKSNKWNLEKVMIVVFFLSFCIEFLQLFGGRMFEIDDIIANSSGTLIGYLLFESLDGIIEEKTRNKSIIKGMCTILGSAILLVGLSFISNGDTIQAQEDIMYSDMELSEDEINDISKMLIYSNGTEKDITTSEVLWEIYPNMGTDISNAASSYVQNVYNDNINNIIENTDGEYLEIFFNSTHRFTFYNNHNLVLENVRHILYDLNDGTIYIGEDNSDNFSNILKYENKEYPFKINQNIYETIKRLY